MSTAVGSPPGSLAETALGLVPTDPAQADDFGARAADDARSLHDLAAESTALRARGLAAKELGRPEEGLALLREAVRLGRRSGDPRVTAEARMSLALVLTYCGAIAPALAQLDRAVPDLDGLALARARTQRGLVLHRAGRIDAAIAELSRAVPVLRLNGDRLWEARALNNRGILHALRGDLAAAESDLARAEDLHRANGSRLAAVDTHWNRGYVAGRCGDVPTALRLFAEAEAEYGQGELDPGRVAVAQIDRCEVLLAAGLVADAYDAAAAAVTAARAAAMASDLADALLLQAQAALDLGRPNTALPLAAEAHGLLKQQRRPGWRALAEYTVLRARWSAGEEPAELLPAACSAARRLAAAGLRVAAIDARLIAGRLALAAGRVDTAHRELDVVRTSTGGRRADLASRCWHARALLRLSAGDTTGARRALLAGLRVLDDYRATVGASELRVHVSGHGADLAALGLDLALQRHEPRDVLRWIDRCRASAARFPPPRPPLDDQLAADLAELRRSAAELEQAELAGRPAAELAAWVERLETRVRRRTHTLSEAGVQPPPAVVRPDALADAAASAGDAAVVTLAYRHGEVVAVTLAGRRFRLRRLGPIRAEVRRAQEHVQFALRRLTAAGDRAPVDALAAALAAGAAELDRLLLAPLRGDIGDRPLVVLPPAELHTVAWSLLPTCHGRPVSVAPSPSTWHRAVVAPERRRGRVVAVAGPGLPAASREVAEVARLHPDGVALLGRDATTSAVTAAVDDAWCAHVAAHARIRADNPLFSALSLADGPLMVHDIERIPRPPQVFVLSACQSGTGALRPGDELTGLATTLLAAGSRTLVASVVWVPDDRTVDVMAALHGRLAAGDEPAGALAAVQNRDHGDPRLAATAAAFGCFGAG